VPASGVDMSTMVKYGALSADIVGEEPIDMVRIVFIMMLL
jgi:hypothetical protein